MKYISKQLASEIRSKYEYLQEVQVYDMDQQCRKKIERKMEQEAQVQSYEIENPNSEIPFSIPRNGNKKRIKEGTANIRNAFNWGLKNYDPKLIDDVFIREIAGRILPDYHGGGIAQYRNIRARIMGASKIPPEPYKLITKEMPEFIGRLRGQLAGKDILDKVIGAISAHFHIARIHPFTDGNGRTARTLQDIILTSNKIPVPLLSSGERHFYYDCLEKATIGWADNQAMGITHGASEGERLFYDLIAGKINTSMDHLIEKCPRE